MVPDPYNQDLSDNKAIHIYFSQAVPLVTYIDDNCLNLKDKKCTICLGVCKNDAIDFTQKAEKVEVKVGAIVLSPGFEIFDPRLRGDFGYGKMENVVTSLDFERILCATGPYEGEIKRPSDKKHPHKIAWIQCVGSRQVKPGGNTYCSAVCCSYTQKQVILAKDHDAELDATIFHNDIRSFGKDFERFYKRTENLPDVRFIRSYVSIGKEIPESKNVTIRYSTPADGVKEEEFDLVVLSVGLNPPKDVEGPGRHSSASSSNPHGFCKTNPENSIETTRPGIFVSGAFQGPMDIPESVVTRERRRRPRGPTPFLPAREAGQRKDLSTGKGHLGRRDPGGRVRVPLWSEYRTSRRCTFRRRLFLGLEKRRSRRRKSFCLRHGLCPADIEHDP